MPTTEPSAFRFYPQDRDGAAIFYITGRITLQAVAELREAFWKAVIRSEIHRLVLVLEQVPELDPSTLSLLVATKNLAAKYKVDLVLVGLDDSNIALLAETHLKHYFDLYATLEDALSSA